MKRVLVTGAAGFIGRHTLAPLRYRGYEIFAVTSSRKDKQDLGCHWIECDLLLPSAVETLMKIVRPEYMLHLAWDTRPGKYWTSEENYEWVKSGIDLLLSFKRYGGRRFVGGGTCAEYSWSTGDILSEYETPRKPSTTYGICKNALRELAESYAIANGLSFSWAHIFNVFGPGEHIERLVPYVINALMSGSEAECSSGEQKRDYLYVKDAGSALASLLDSKAEGPVNIASGRTIALRKLIMLIGRIMGKESFIRLGAISGNDDSPDIIEADTHRLNREVGWFPAYSVESGIREAIEWWKTKRETTDENGI